MTTATSSSDRYAEARAVLADFDTYALNELLTHFEDKLGDTLRALIEPPATDEPPEQIISDLFRRTWGMGLREALTLAVHAGIDAAWTSWEPENAPGVVDTRETFRIEDLDGTEDAADWLTTGHVLDADEVEWLRTREMVK